tara:strand:- start:36 stop:518 length:483 start_codon:yes stop_codon:yes gene_type:complete
MRKPLFLITLLLFVSCNSDISGVIFSNNAYSSLILKIMDDEEKSKFDILEKYLIDESTLEYSGYVFKGKKNIIRTRMSDSQFFSNILLRNKNVSTTFNKDRTYTTFLKCNWLAKGIYTKDTYDVLSFYEFTWKNDKIISIKVFWNELPYYKEYNEFSKNI